MEEQTNKQVGITPKAHEALNELRKKALEAGVSLSKGAIASKLILTARPEDVWEKER